MSEGERDRLLIDHSYDGIQEYDNPLPGWWVWLFWATIVFSVIYVVYYHLGPGPSVIGQYEADVRAAAEREARLAAKTAPISDASLAGLKANPALMASAKQIFATRCGACHGAQGQGIIGPNLTDEYWIHGGALTDILKVIANGVPEKGMVPWKGQLQPQEMEAVTAYIASLKGTNPSNPRPPQGVNAKGEPAPGWQPGK